MFSIAYIIVISNYNIYRSDRSQLTHPSDPDNPSKFRKFGGGVLIATRSDIDATIKRISMRRGAEIVAVELSIKDVKYIFCVVYRVGTLGIKNHKSIVESIQPFFTGRKAKKIFILGDFNLSNVTWPHDENMQDNVSLIEKSFVESFSNYGLQQCITDPTHMKGRILDLLLTNCPGIVASINVDKNASICKSDHFPILRLRLMYSIKNHQKGRYLTLKGLTGMRSILIYVESIGMLWLAAQNLKLLGGFSKLTFLLWPKRTSLP